MDEVTDLISASSLHNLDSCFSRQVLLLCYANFLPSEGLKLELNVGPGAKSKAPIVHCERMDPKSP